MCMGGGAINITAASPGHATRPPNYRAGAQLSHTRTRQPFAELKYSTKISPLGRIRDSSTDVLVSRPWHEVREVIGYVERRSCTSVCMFHLRNY
jgi:hypothetical protein